MPTYKWGKPIAIKQVSAYISEDLHRVLMAYKLSKGFPNLSATVEFILNTYFEKYLEQQEKIQNKKEDK